jgi:hypothetical protein
MERVMKKSVEIVAVVVAGALALASCGGNGSSPSSPSGTSGTSAAWGSGAVSGGGAGAQAWRLVGPQPDGGVQADNNAPRLFLKTDPPMDTRVSPALISGASPLRVHFNLCKSDDPDQVLNPDGTENPSGDTLNWQFNFGDSKPAFNADGSFNPDFDHFCRVDHTYGPGEYTATVSVTDKHLEDQAGGVAALARVTQTVRIVVSNIPGPQVTSLFVTPNPAVVFDALADPDCTIGFFGFCTFRVNVTTSHPENATLTLALSASPANGVAGDVACEVAGGPQLGGPFVGTVPSNSSVFLTCAVNNTLGGTAMPILVTATDPSGNSASRGGTVNFK